MMTNVKLQIDMWTMLVQSACAATSYLVYISGSAVWKKRKPNNSNTYYML